MRPLPADKEIAFAFLQPVPPKTLRLRPRESRHQTKHSTWGSFHLPAMPLRLVFTHHHDLLSIAPRLHLHPARRQPRVLLQVYRNWYLAAAACTCLAAPPARRLAFAQKWIRKNGGRGLCLPPTRGVRCFLFAWTCGPWSPSHLVGDPGEAG